MKIERKFQANRRLVEMETKITRIKCIGSLSLCLRPSQIWMRNSRLGIDSLGNETLQMMSKHQEIIQNRVYLKKMQRKRHKLMKNQETSRGGGTATSGKECKLKKNHTRLQLMHKQFKALTLGRNKIQFICLQTVWSWNFHQFVKIPFLFEDADFWKGTSNGVETKFCFLF